MALEKEYGIKHRSDEVGAETFASAASLSRFVEGRGRRGRGLRRDPGHRSSAAVVVTGVGVVSACGWGVGRSARGLWLAGRTAIGPFSPSSPAGHRTRVAAEVPPPPDGLDGAPPAGERLTPASASPSLPPPRRWTGLRSAAGVADAGVFFGGSTGGMRRVRGVARAGRAGRRGPNPAGALAGFSAVHAPARRWRGASAPAVRWPPSPRPAPPAPSPSARRWRRCAPARRRWRSPAAPTRSAASPTAASTPSARSTRRPAVLSAPGAAGCRSAKERRRWCWRRCPPRSPAAPVRWWSWRGPAPAATPTT